MSGHVPPPGGVVLDHVGWFVADLDTAGQALAAMGLRPTDRSDQRVPGPGGRPIAAGTANRCVMLERGYLEFLAAVGPGATADRMRAALSTRAGLHLAAFGLHEVASAAARLDADGFGPTMVIDLGRDTPVGRLAFSVLRTEPAAMAEGRIQFLRHHTPELLWATGPTSHPNGVTALVGVVAQVADLEETSDRWARFLGRPAADRGDGHRAIAVDGALVHLVDACAAARLGCAIGGAGLAAAVVAVAPGAATGITALPPELGGHLIRVAADDPIWR